MWLLQSFVIYISLSNVLLIVKLILNNQDQLQAYGNEGVCFVGDLKFIARKIAGTALTNHSYFSTI